EVRRRPGLRLPALLDRRRPPSLSIAAAFVAFSGRGHILGHFGKRHSLDWRPIGPKRRTRKQIVGFFAPALEELKYVKQLITGIPLPIGPTVQGQGFWFRRKPDREST
ncbi:MAG TPA: hypothetical protein VEK15_12090, partial [Vicinamibacteria bacterium]|nr:hypothetical protein [Vicinamibacteria bacterium]